MLQAMSGHLLRLKVETLSSTTCVVLGLDELVYLLLRAGALFLYFSLSFFQFCCFFFCGTCPLDPLE